MEDTPRRRVLGAFVPALVGVVCLAGCVTTAPPVRTPGSAATVVEGVPSLEYGPDQCGPGALAAVMRFWGRPVTVADLARDLPTVRNGGVLSVDLLLAARERGFEAELETGSPETLAAAIHEGEPLILLVRVRNAPGQRADLFHYIVVDGIDEPNGLVRLHFGEGPPRWGRLAKLDKAWQATDRMVLRLRPAGPMDTAPAHAGTS